MLYSFDTSAFLEPWNRHYPRDHFPSLWEKLGDLINSGNIIATEEVRIELARIEDDVYRWALEREKMFIPVRGEIQQAVKSILDKYPRLVDKRRNRSGADPFVIALAQIQMEKCTVVTYETHGNIQTNPRIPDVCDALGIRCINVSALIQDEGWVF